MEASNTSVLRIDELDKAATAEELVKLPSLPLAYDLSVKSYDTILGRVDGVDSRIQSILTLSIMVIALSPALATARHLTFSSVWFIAATVTAGLLLFVGSIARLTGTFVVIDPNLIEPWEEDATGEFQRNFVIHAGHDFNKNCKLLTRNYWMSVIVNLLFFVEVILLIIWAAIAVVAA